MRREEMIEHICEKVREADDTTVEQFYWFLMLEMCI